MLNPRIYRAAFLPVLVAVVVLAFSFRSEPGPLGTNLAPAAFNGQAAFNTLTNLGRHYPGRRPGSPGDNALADRVAADLGAPPIQFRVRKEYFGAGTAVGTRTVENVIAEQTGSSSRRIVVIAHRDALHPGSPADLSGTATMIELARVLAGRTLNRTVELVSTSGSTGLAGATHLAGSLGGPIDAVIVLGDVAGSRVAEPVVVPWSSGENMAPLLLRSTAGAAVRAQAAIPPGGANLAAQFARLAFPLTLSEQGPFNARGIPAVLLSRAGERGPSTNTPVNEVDLASFGSAALQTISALDAGPDIPPPAAYLTYKQMTVPLWPIRLLVLTLILPVLCAAIDAFARARRRGHEVGRWAGWVLATALPFALASLFVAALGAMGLVEVAAPGPVAAGTPANGGAVVEIAVAALVLVVAMFPIRAFIVRRIGPRGDPTGAGGGAAVLIVLCAISLVLWAANPFAAALVVPALHLWMWIVAPEIRLRVPVTLALLLAGLAPIALVLLYYATQFGLGPAGVIWTGTLLIAGGGLGLPALLEWSVVAGCAVSVAVIAARSAGVAAPEPAPVTVRGPITYAGPGSLGGTKSALRR
ncbi:MAG TPA: M28 family peptidase [Solirubrobacteraceae bacterium]|nr:M28 family peptidase [Solirubrobacteraceae bacterium]